MPTRTPSERIRELGISLPDAPKPIAAYVPVRISRGVAYVSGQLPFEGGQLRCKGLVPRDVSQADATSAARLCAINALAAAKQALGDLDRIRGVIRLGVFVACEAGYEGQPAIANGASELMADVFGEPGRHARAAVGVASLPLNAPVEIEFMFELADETKPAREALAGT